MADVILFHHVLGLTPGVIRFADQLRAAGHRVTVPDLYEGATFSSLDDGGAYAEEIGFETVVERGVAAAAGVPDRAVYAGFSLGVMPAQKLAQTRAGALAAILYHGGVPASLYGTEWPAEVVLQAHVNDQDPWGELDEVVAPLVKGAADAQLFTYSGTDHLFTDAGLAEYNPESAALVMERTLGLLSRWP
jgi:dienelactone hydrolase